MRPLAGRAKPKGVGTLVIVCVVVVGGPSSWGGGR